MGNSRFQPLDSEPAQQYLSSVGQARQPQGEAFDEQDYLKQQEDERKKQLAMQEQQRRERVAVAQANRIQVERDPETGKREVATHPDGSPKFQAGPITGVQPIGQTTTAVQGDDGKPRALPNTNIMLGGDMGGALGAVEQGTRTTETTMGQQVMDDRGRVSSVEVPTKTDPKTGQKTYQEKNESTGRMETKPAGIDWDARERAARVARNDEERNAAALAANEATQRRTQFQPRFEPVKAEYLAAKQELEKLPDFSKSVRRGTNGQWVVVNPDTGAETKASPEQVAFVEKQRKDRQARFDRAKTAFDSLNGEHEEIQAQEAAARDARRKAENERLRIETGLPDEFQDQLEVLAKSQGQVESTTAEDQAAAAEDAAAKAEIQPTASGRPGGFREFLNPYAGKGPGKIEPQKSADPIKTGVLLPESSLPAFNALKDLNGVEIVKEAQFTKLRKGKQWIASLEDDRGSKVLTLRPEARKQKDLADLVNTEAPGGGSLPLYLDENPNREPHAKNIEWATRALQIAKSPEPGASAFLPQELPQGAQILTREQKAQALKELGATPGEIQQKIRTGLIDLRTGNLLLKNLFGKDFTYRPTKHDDPQAFTKWMADTTARELAAGVPKDQTTEAKWRAANTSVFSKKSSLLYAPVAPFMNTFSFDAQNEIRRDYTAKWAEQNQGMIPRAEIKAKYGEDASANASWAERAESFIAGAAKLTKENAVASSVGMAVGVAQDLSVAEANLFGIASKEAVAALSERIGMRVEDWEAFKNTAGRNWQKWSTREGIEKGGAFDQAVKTLERVVDEEADSPTPNQARIDAAASAAAKAAIALHNLNPDEVAPTTERDLNPKFDKALGSALQRYQATADPRALALYRDRLLMGNRRRAVSALIEERTKGMGDMMRSFTAALTAGPQEIASEAAGDALMMASGFASKAAQFTLSKAGQVAAAGRIATTTQKIASAVARFETIGQKAETLAAPLTRGQKAYNAVLGTGKTALKAIGSENFEEVILLPGEESPDFWQTVKDTTLSIGGMLPYQGALSRIGEKIAEGSFEARNQAALQKFTDEYNAHFINHPNFVPISVETARAASLFVNPRQAEADLKKIAGLTQQLQLTDEEQSSRDKIMPGTRQAQLETNLAKLQARMETGNLTPTQRANTQKDIDRIQQRIDQHSAGVRGIEKMMILGNVQQAAAQIAARDQFAVDAATAIEGLPAEERAAYSGLAKVATGNIAALTDVERKAIQGKKTASGASYFEQVKDAKGAPVVDQATNIPAERLTADAVAEISASVPALGRLIRATANLGHIQEAQGTAVEESQQPPADAPANTNVAKYAGMELAQYEALRSQDPSLPEASAVVSAARAAGMPVHPTMEKAAGPAPAVQPASNPAPAAQAPSVPDSKGRAQSVADRVKESAEKRMPGLKGRLSIIGESSNSGGADLVIETGEIRLSVPDIERAIQRADGDVDAVAEYLENVVARHEAVHVVQVQALQAEWEAAREKGYSGSFLQFFEEFYTDLAKDLLTPEAQKAARAIYGRNKKTGQHHFDNIPTDWQKAAEFVRMLVEAKLDGNTEQFSELLRAVKTRGAKSKLAKLIRKAVEILTGMRLSPAAERHVEQLKDLYAQLTAKEESSSAAPGEQQSPQTPETNGQDQSKGQGQGNKAKVLNPAEGSGKQTPEPSPVVSPSNEGVVDPPPAPPNVHEANPDQFILLKKDSGQSEISYNGVLVWRGPDDQAQAELRSLEEAMSSPMRITGAAIKAAIDRFPRLGGKLRAELEAAADEIIDELDALPANERQAAAENAISNRINQIADREAENTGKKREEVIEGFRAVAGKRASQQAASIEQAVIGTESPEVPAGRVEYRDTPNSEMQVEVTSTFVDLDQLVGSSDPLFPGGALQPRDRSGQASQNQREEMVRNLRDNDNQHRRYIEGATTDSGRMVVAPLFGADGKQMTNEAGKPVFYVISGNGRRNALAEAHARKVSSKVEKGFRETAAAEGINVEGLTLPVPVSVFVPKSAKEAIDLAEYSNRDAQLSVTNTEQANRDSASIETAGILKLWNPDASGDAAAASNRAFVKAFARAVGDEGILDARGELTDEGAKRIERALVAMLLGPEQAPLLDMLFNRAGALGLRAILGGVASESGSLLKLASEKPDFDLSPVLANALRTAVEAKQALANGEIRTLGEFFDQGSLFDSTENTPERQLARAIVESRSRKAIRDILGAYRRGAEAVDTSTMSMFAEAETTREDLILKALESRPIEQVIAEAELEFGKNADFPAKLRVIAPGIKRLNEALRRDFSAAIAAEVERLRSGGLSAEEHQRLNPDSMTEMAAMFQRFLDSHDEKTIHAGFSKLLNPKVQNALASSPAPESIPASTPIEVVDTQTGEVVWSGTYAQRDTARRVRDRRDIKYGAVRFRVRMTPQTLGSSQAPDSRLTREFGENFEADEYGMPVIPKTIPDGHPLLVETVDKSTAIIPADHPLVIGLPKNHDLAKGLPDNHPAFKGGFLQAGAMSRRAMRRGIVRFFMSFGTPVPEDTAPVAYATGGGGGAGKSTILKILRNDGVINTDGAIPVNADDIKSLIPEWKEFMEVGDGRAAAIVHEESSKTAKDLLGKILTSPQRFNFVYDATLANSPKAIRSFNEWKAAGYDVMLIGVTIEPREAITRAFLRGKGSGRWVPTKMLVEAHAGFNRGVIELAAAADAAYIYDNTPPDAHKIAEKIVGADTISIVNREYFGKIQLREEEVSTLRSQDADYNQRGADQGGSRGQQEIRQGSDGDGYSTGQASLKEDLRAQAEWLVDQAEAQGYESVDELLRQSPETFEILAQEWRAAHPRGEGSLAGRMPEGGGRAQSQTLASSPAPGFDLFGEIEAKISGPRAQAKRKAIEAAKAAPAESKIRANVAKTIGRMEKLSDIDLFSAAATRSLDAKPKRSESVPDERDLFSGTRGTGDRRADGNATSQSREKRAGGDVAGEDDLFGFRPRNGGTGQHSGFGVRGSSGGRGVGSDESPAGADRGGKRATAESGLDGRGGRGGRTEGIDADGDRGHSVAKAKRDEIPLVPVPANEADRNARIDPQERLSPKGGKAKVQANFDAIKLLRVLNEEGRNPTAEEKRVLLAYSGWGAFKGAFDDAKADAFDQISGNGNPDAYYNREWRSISRDEFKRRHGDRYKDANGKEQASVYDLYAWNENHGETHRRLKEELSDSEYAAARRSVLNAHYTTPEIIGSMWGMLERLGFRGGRVLEPAGGIGHYIGTQPEHLAARTQWSAVELDQVTAQILGKLYPQARVNSASPDPSRTIEGQGFEEAVIAPNSMDLVISNVPFHETGPWQSKKQFGIDFNLHNYFFARALEVTRPGGLVAFITSSSTMENNSRQRQKIASMGELVAAVRLPNTAFKENAGTEVTTDIIILRKPDGRAVPTHDWQQSRSVGRDTVSLRRNKDQTPRQFLDGFDSEGKWLDGELEAARSAYRAAESAAEQQPKKPKNPEEKKAKVDAEKAFDAAQKAYIAALEQAEQRSLDGKLEAEVPIRVNEYFAANPSHAFGVHRLQGSMYRANEYTLAPEEGGPSFAERFQAVIDSLPENIIGQADSLDVATFKEAERGDRPFSFVQRNGEIFQVEGAKLIPVDWTAGEKAVFLSWSRVKDATRAIVAAELDPQSTEAELKKLRDKLNREYDSHIYRHGPISKTGRGGRHGHLTEDPDFSLTSALEDEQRTVRERALKSGPRKGKMVSEAITTYSKADIFRVRMNKPLTPPDRVESVADAVNASMVWMGYPNAEYMGQLLGRDAAEVEREALQSGMVFTDPKSGMLVIRDAYLSGNVREKLNAARDAMEIDPAAYRKNVEALEAALPERKSIAKIGANLGAPWLPNSVIEAYMTEELGLTEAKVRYMKESNHWNITGFGNSPKFSTAKVPTVDLLDHAMSLTSPRLTKKEGSGKDARIVPDPAGTQLATSKLDALKKDFARWVKTTDHMIDGVSVPEIVENVFNEKLNGFVPPRFEGAHITLPGASDIVYRNGIRRAAIARMLDQGGGMIAHGVGFGKTFTLIGLAMELKRLGKANRPMITVDNATLHQFAASFRAAYPNAKLLVADEKTFSAENRRRFVARVATGDFDAIVIAHSQFNLIPNHPDVVNSWIDQQIAELTAVKGLTDTANKRAVAALEKAMINLENSRKKILADLEKRQDMGLFWEDLGVDALLVDEAHRYKNAPVITKMTDIKNIPTGEASQRAIGMTLKTQSVQGKKAGKGVFFATGTPVTNTMAEAYIMLRYTNPELLESQDIYNFDNFAQIYGDVVEKVESTWKGKLESVKRFAKFVNGSALINLIRSSWDVQMDPDAAGLDRPTVKGGRAELLTLNPGGGNQMFNNWVVQTIAAQWEDQRFWDHNPWGQNKREAFENEPWLGAVPIMTMQAGIAAALDPRLIDPATEDGPNTKVNTAVRRIREYYDHSADWNGTQAVFVDLRKPFGVSHLVNFAGDPGMSEDGANAGTNFDLYQDIAQKLVAAGIPRSEIALVSADMPKPKRTEVFERVNSGEVRVVVGSSDTMGIGVNMQERLYALHHLMPPRDFKPAMMEQRNGRILRQGNMHYDLEVAAYVATAEAETGRKFRKEKKGKLVPDIKAAREALADMPEARAKAEAEAEKYHIRIIEYGMEKSIDSAIYQMMAAKQLFINQILMGEVSDSFEDPTDEVSMSMAEMAARTIGDPLMIRMVELERDTRAIRTEYDGWLENSASVKRQLAHYRSSLAMSRYALPDARRRANEVASKRAKEDGKFDVWEWPGATIDRNKPAEAEKGWKQPKLIEPLDLFLLERAKDLRRSDRKVDSIPFKVSGIDIVVEIEQQFGDDKSSGSVRFAGDTGGGFMWNGAQSLNAAVLSLFKKAEAAPTGIEMDIAKLEREIPRLEEAASQPFEKQAQLDAIETEREVVLFQLRQRGQQPAADTSANRFETPANYPGVGLPPRMETLGSSPAPEIDATTVRDYLRTNGTPDSAIQSESERVSRALAQHRSTGVAEGRKAYSQSGLFGGVGTAEHPEKLGREIALRASRAYARAKARAGRDSVSQDLIAGFKGDWAALAREVNNKGRASAVLSDLVNREIPSWTLIGTKLETPEDVHAVMLPIRSPYFESLKVMVLDGNNNVVHAQILTVGSIAETAAHPADVFGLLARLRETSGKKYSKIIISHNHPSGDPSPSRADEQVTRRLVEIAIMTGWDVVDHVITNGERYFSFREFGHVWSPNGRERSYKPRKDDGKKPKQITPDQRQAPWEAVKMINLRTLHRPELGAEVAKELRNANPNAAHILFLNTRLALVGVERIQIENGELGKKQLAQALLAGRMRDGAHGFTIATADGMSLTKTARIATEVANLVQMRFVDVVYSYPGGYSSGQEQGIVQEDSTAYGSTLGSSPAPEASSAVQQALAKMPPIYREVFAEIEAGDSPSVVMQRHGISEKAVSNILNQARARIAVATAAAGDTLKPAMDGDQINGGRPDLAISTNPTVAAVDQLRNESSIPDVRKWKEVNESAAAMLAKDYQGTYDELLAKARDMQPMTDKEVAAAKMIISRETIGGRISTAAERVKLGMLIYGYREIGTETARALAIRRDPDFTPAERHAQIIAEALFTPDAETRQRMRNNPKAAETILAGWMTRVDSIEHELKMQGINIRAALEEFRANQEAIKQAAAESPQAASVIEAQIRKLSRREKAVIEAIRSGALVTKAALLTGLTTDEVKAIYGRFLQDIRAAMAESAKRYLAGVLGSSPAGDMMSQILTEMGLPDLSAIDDTAPNFVDRRNQKKRAPRKPKAPKADGEQDGKPSKPAAPAPAPPKVEGLTPEQQARLDEAWERFQKAGPSTWVTLWQEETKKLTPIVGAVGFANWKGKVLKPWVDLWQTEMDALRPQSRITFDEWIAKPANVEKFRPERDLFPQPINETTGEWDENRPFTGQGELIRPDVNETTGTFDLHDPVAMKRVMDAFALARGSKMDAAMEFWRMSILSGPQTHGVNMSSNALNSAYRLLPRRVVEATVNNLLSVVGLGDKGSATYGELVPMAKQLRKAAALAGRMALRSWQLESRTIEAYAKAEAIQLDFTGLGAEYIPPALGGKFGKLMRSISSRAMTAADEFQKSFNAQVLAAAYAHRIASVEEKLKGKAYEKRFAELMEPGSVAWVLGFDETKEITFQKDLDGSNPRSIHRLDQLAELAKHGRNLPWLGRVLTFFLPFIDTPTNIFKQALEVSPIGGFLAVVDGARALKRKVMRGNLSKAEAAKEAAALYDRARLVQDVTNQTIMLAAYFALESLLVGDDDDDDRPWMTGTVPYKTTSRGERDNAYAVMPPMTIRLPGGIEFSYARFDPASTVLASMIDFINIKNRQGGFTPAVASEWLMRFKDQAKDKTFLQGVSNLINAVEDPDRFAERITASTLTGFVPNLIRQPIRESDLLIRDSNPRADDGFLTAVAKRVGYSIIPQAAPAKIDVWGNPVKANRGDLIGGNRATDMAFRIFDPTNLVVNPTADPIDRWIFRYNQATADSKDRIAIQPIGNSISMKVPGEDRSKAVPLSVAEQMESNINAGKAARLALGDGWDKLPLTEENAKIITDTVQSYQKQERERIKNAKIDAMTPP